MWKSVIYAPELTTEVVKPNPKKSARFSAFYPPISAVLFSAALIAYGLTRTHLNTFDAVAYANQIELAAETGKLRPLFHPHHLLFNALGYLCWRCAQALGYEGGPLAVMQEMNAILGAAGLALYYTALRRLQPLGYLPILVTLSLAGSFGYWICATDGRVNMPSLVLMIAAFDTLLRFRETPTARLAGLIGLVAGAAVLFHESAGLFGLVGAAGIALTAGEPRNRLRGLWVYGAAWSAVAALPYLLVGVVALHFHSLSAFHHWAGAYTERGWWWDFHILHNLRLDMFALRHAVFVEPLGRAALAQTPLHAGGLPVVIALWGLYLGALTGLLVAGLLIAVTLNSLLRSPDRSQTLLCLLWVGVYALFFTVWCPGAFVFWVPALVPLGVLLLLSLRHLRPFRRRTARFFGLWIAACTLLNLLAGIVPYLKPVAGLSQRVAADMAAHTPPRALIVVAGVGDDAQCEVDIPYFARRPVLSLHGVLARARSFPEAQAEVQTTLDRALEAHRTVYVTDEIWHNRQTAAALRHQCPLLSASDIEALFAEYHPVPSWNGPRGLVWKLQGRISHGARRTLRGNESFTRRSSLSPGPA